MKKYLYLLAVSAICAFVAKTAWDMGRQYEGVCLEKGRALTDEEKIRAVVTYMNSSQTGIVKMQIAGNEHTNYKPYTGYVSQRRIPSKSVDEFLKENPSCCEVEMHNEYYNGESRSLDRATGFYAGHVKLHYTLHYLDESGIKRDASSTAVYTVQNCGVVNSNH